MNATAHPPKKASSKKKASALPSTNQMIALALAMAEHHLSKLIEIRIADDQWNEDDIHVDNATEVALRQILSMKKMQFSNYSDFMAEWFYAASPLNLAAKTFSRTNCLYERCLKAVVIMFNEMGGAVEFASYDGP